jgi:putative transposase
LLRFALINSEKAEFPVRTMCRVLDVSGSGFFAWKGRPASQRQRDDMIYLAHIRTAFELSNRTYGSPRMHRELVDEGLPIGRRRTARLMRETGLAARQKRRFKRTTDSTHAWPVAPNLLNQDLAAEAPDQKWSADISYVWTAEGWLYLAVLIDLFSRRVIGWAVSGMLKKDLALRALRMVLATRHPPSGPVHHSDRLPPIPLTMAKRSFRLLSGLNRQVPVKYRINFSVNRAKKYQASALWNQTVSK